MLPLPEMVEYFLKWATQEILAMAMFWPQLNRSHPAPCVWLRQIVHCRLTWAADDADTTCPDLHQ